MIVVVNLRAERRAGEMLKEVPKNEGGRPANNLSHDVIGYKPIPTLPELGITLMQSSRWQAEAEIPEEICYTATLEKLQLLLYILRVKVTTRPLRQPGLPPG